MPKVVEMEFFKYHKNRGYYFRRQSKQDLKEWLGIRQVKMAVQVGGIMIEIAQHEKERRGGI